VRDFQYLEPGNLDEALERLREHGEEAKIMAGGQALVLLMRENLVHSEMVISLLKVPSLNGICLDEAKGFVEVGALTTHRQIESSTMIHSSFPFLHEAYGNLANIQVRNMATLGGNLCHNAPGSDPPAPLIALDAKVTLRSSTRERSLSVEEFGTNFYETALAPDEILTGVRIPLLLKRTGTAYQKYAARPSDMAVVGVAARVTLSTDGKTCQDIRVALTGVAPTTIRARHAEEALRGQKLNDRLISEAGQIAAGEIDPISDIHASADYRRQITPPTVRRMVTLAWKRATAALPN
jgi:aerobic carbon-monoxide dehydrogenase medium subunit